MIERIINVKDVWDTPNLIYVSRTATISGITLPAGIQ